MAKNIQIESDRMLINEHFRDLNPLLCGQQHCPPKHSFGPAIRNHTLLHCVVSGKGRLICEGKTYFVESGQIFRILPGKKHFYQADKEDPWYYYWIGFDGELSSKIAQLPPVFDVSDKVINLFKSTIDHEIISSYRVTATLFRLYDELFHISTENINYVDLIRDYIEVMYMQKLQIDDLANHFHLNRSYMSRLFKQKTGKSIQDFIIETRMNNATNFLMEGMLIKDVAVACGYEDPFLFSKMFKSIFGVSPTEWRANNSNFSDN